MYCSKSCALIGFSRGHDGPILHDRGFPRLSRKSDKSPFCIYSFLYLFNLGLTNLVILAILTTLGHIHISVLKKKNTCIGVLKSSFFLRHRYFGTVPSRGSDDHIQKAVPSSEEDTKAVSSFSNFMLETLTL